MTIFGWDASHYDGRITRDIAARARAEGIDFATHKLGEAGNYVDPLAAANLTAFRDVGMPVIGAYYVPRTPGVSIPNQVVHCISTADKLIPWWRDYPGFFWQDDVELWDYDRVSAKIGITFGQLLAMKSGKPVALYASRGMYGDQLAAWKPGILWNANYGQNPIGPFRDVYPGDRSTRWASYSGMAPAILQYGSKTTIAGLTTCDANAFRGTLAELLALIAPATKSTGGPDMQLTDKVTLVDKPDVHYSSPTSDVGHLLASTNYYVLQTRNLVSQVIDLLGDSRQLEQTIAAAVAGLPTGVTVDEATMQAAFVGALRELAAPPAS